MPTILNLKEELIKQADEMHNRHDDRFKSWVRRVVSVDPAGTDGFAFKGNFVPDGTVEIHHDSPQVFLLMTTSGSRRHRTRHYDVFIMDTDGNLHHADIYTNSAERGWALRIRDRVINLLDALSNEPEAVC